MALPFTGPTLLSLHPLGDGSEKMQATMAALEGLALSARPGLWQPYASAKSEIWQVAKPATELKARFPRQTSAIDAVIAKSGHAPASLAYLPMVGRNPFWTVFLDPLTANIVAFMPLDSF